MKLANQFETSVITLLKEERLKQGLSYETLAEKSGVHRTAISLIERGLRHPSLLICIKISLALGLPPEKWWRK